ncbi:MAG: hypothetical protein KAR47_03515 [Planctomycetes bacterium]|nr:hypothetical protein [Planctomycetota bacterium]
MKFPKYFPTQCPPGDCSEVSGTFYRVIKGDIPVREDFLPHWLLRPHKQKDWIKNGKACEACGLSMNPTLEDLKRKGDFVPSLRDRNIAKGTLEPGMGKIKSTPSRIDATHHTWWVPGSIKDPSVFFKVVA